MQVVTCVFGKGSLFSMCELLFLLSQGPENREALMRQGGVEVILDSVSRHNIRTSLPF